MRLIEFNGAYMAADEDRGYKSSGKQITVIAEQVVAFYDHTILTASNKIRVMETYDEIKAKLTKKG